LGLRVLGIPLQRLLHAFSLLKFTTYIGVTRSVGGTEYGMLLCTVLTVHMYFILYVPTRMYLRLCVYRG
jgi:hypothetical protein